MDFLRDIGGLFGALGPLFGIFVAMFQYRGIYMSLSTVMFSEDDTKKGPKKKGEKEETNK